MITKILIALFLLVGINLSSFAQESASGADVLRKKKEAQELYNQAVNLLASKQYQPALDKLNQAIGILPDYALAYLQRAKIKYDTKAVHGAEQDYRTAIKADPTLGEAFFGLGYLFFSLDSLQPATSNFDQAIAAGFETYFVFYYRGLAKLKVNDVPGAIMDFNKSLERKSDFALAYHDRASAKMAMNDLTGAIYDYSNAVNYDPGFVLAYNNMGSAKRKTGDYQGAINDYNTALKLQPDFYTAFNNRGSARFVMGDLEGAEADFLQCMELKPDYVPALNNMANLLAGKGKYTEAIEFLNKVLISEPDLGEAYLNRGLIHEMMGELDKACEDWKLAETLNISEATEYLKECN